MKLGMHQTRTFVFKHLICVFIIVESVGALYDACKPRDFGHGSVVCVCSESYCDGFRGSLSDSGQKKSCHQVYTSSKSGKRFEESSGMLSLYEDASSKFEKGDSVGHSASQLTITINGNKTKQEILGFGGAFTDAATMNIFEMSKSLQNKLYASYFSESGIEYSVGRVPMASCDFSTHVYSYDDNDGDFQLTNFTLAQEDVEFKIPGIKAAIKHAKHPLKLFGSPWSSSPWLKTSGKMEGPGTLIGKAGDKYHQTWANYFVKFLQSYESAGIPKFWGLTVENEPSAGMLPSYDFQCLGFTDEMERDFVKKDLGPALTARGYQNLNLMILDDQRYFLPSFADTLLSDPESKKYVKGIGVHWYGNSVAPASLLDVTHERHPDTFILATEACAGSQGKDRGVTLGSWERGEEYSHDILENLNHWVVGWVDWNFVLDMQGGPNWVRNFVDAPIIWDKSENVFYKQPMFYHMGHFSKFIPPGSRHVESTASATTKLEFAAFVRPDGALVLVVLNKESTPQHFRISDAVLGTLVAEIPERAIQTYVLVGHA